jgi:hypothetical protein
MDTMAVSFGGFTLSKRPEGKGELRLAVGVTRARAQKKGDAVILTTPAGRRLEYGALEARDAAGRILPTRMVVPSSDRIVMIVDDRKARYPIVIDPLLTGMDDAMVESNQSTARMGWTVASAGDVNGDGYADVIVGADSYYNGEPGEGAAFVYYGNGGITGKPVLTRQWTGDGARPVQRVGLSRDDSRFVVSMQAFAQGVHRQIKLQVEACPAGSPWGGGDCVTATSADWTAVTAADLPAGVTLEETLTGLVPDTVYHWRARTLLGPDAYGVPGITPCANPAHGPWRRFDAQPAENDIRIGSAADAGGSEGGASDGGCFILIVQSGIGR